MKKSDIPLIINGLLCGYTLSHSTLSFPFILLILIGMGISIILYGEFMKNEDK